MKDFGYWHQARPDTRLCGAFRMLITAQSRTNDVGLLTARPFAPTAKSCAVLAAVKAWPGHNAACRHDPATASLDRSCARQLRNSRVGTKKRLQVEQRNYPKKGHDAHRPVIHPLDRRVRRQELAADRQGNRVKKSCGDEDLLGTIVPCSDFALEPEAVFAGAFRIRLWAMCSKS